MAVTVVAELFEDREGTEDQNNSRSLIRSWHVVTDDEEDDPNIVYQGSGLPVIGDPYITPNYTDLGSVVIRVSARQDSNTPNLWKCTAEYSSETQVQGSSGNVDSSGNGGSSPVSPGDVNANPLLRPPVWTYTGYKIKQLVTEGSLSTDATDPPAVVKILNSAKMPFVPAAEDDMNLPEFTVEIFKPVGFIAFNTLFGENGYINSVNKDTWKGFSARQVKIDNLVIVDHYENGVGCLKVQWKISVNWRTWDLYLLDAGYYELFGSGTPTDPYVHRKIVDDTGREPTEPYLLDGTGKKLAAGADPVYLRYRVKKERTFTGVVP